MRRVRKRVSAATGLHAVFTKKSPIVTPRSSESDLNAAAEEGLLEVVRELVKKGASLDSVDAMGKTACYNAAVADQADVVAFLVGQGADPNARDRDQRDIFWAACAVQAINAAEALLEAAQSRGIVVDMDRNDACGLTPSTYAALKGHAGVTAFLRSRGVVSRPTSSRSSMSP